MRVDSARFARAVALRTAVAWVAGVLVLSGVAAGLSRRSEYDSLDLRLRAHALAVYGLAWFDGDGVFHDEVVRRETALLSNGISAMVFSEEGPVFRSGADQVAPEVLAQIADQVLADGQEIYLSGGEGDPFRLLAIPTSDDNDRRCGVVIAVADPRPVRRAWLTFVAQLAAVAALLIATGLSGSWWLARSLSDRLHEGIRERERFLAAAAHELRTPVATLLAVTGSALAGDEPPARALERVQRIAAGTAELVDRLLAWARLEEIAPDLTPLRLDLLVETCLLDGEPADLEAVVVRADPRLLRIAVENLLRNARTHGRGVREVRVSAGRLVIADRGDGLPAGIDLTAPFITGPGSRGSGLGLALVDRIVAAHGWTLQPGPGPQVTVCWPVARYAAPVL